MGAYHSEKRSSKAAETKKEKIMVEDQAKSTGELEKRLSGMIGTRSYTSTSTAKPSRVKE